MGCCRTIMSQIKLVNDAIGVAQTAEPEDVLRSLGMYRSLLGTYRISNKLARDFRCEIEPEMGRVWSPADMNRYVSRLENFGRSLHLSLVSWASRYCKHQRN